MRSSDCLLFCSGQSGSSLDSVSQLVWIVNHPKVRYNLTLTRHTSVEPLKRQKHTQSKDCATYRGYVEMSFSHWKTTSSNLTAFSGETAKLGVKQQINLLK